MSVFGDELARWMAARRIGVNEFARVSHYSAGYISNLRSGKKSPAPQTAAEFDALLGAGGELAAKAPAPPASGSTDDHGPRLPDIRRRDYLALSASVLALLKVLRAPSVPDLADRVAAAVAGRSRIDDETVDGLAQIMLGYRKVYRSVGAAALLSPVCGTLDLLIELAPDAGIYRHRLVSLISEAGSVAAVILMFDQGDFPTAGRYLAIAARAAQQCDDDELRAVALGCRAFHATYSGTPQVGLEYASEAVATAAHGIHPLTSGWIAAVASEMHATLGPGEEAACMRLLEMAQRQLSEPSPLRPWKGIGAFNGGKLTAYRGGDLMRLGRYPQAQAELHAALAQLDPAFAKHRCTAHIDLATAYLQDGKFDEGVEHAMNALDIIAVTQHADSLRRVEILYPMIKASGIHAARDLRRKLMEIKAAS